MGRRKSHRKSKNRGGRFSERRTNSKKSVESTSSTESLNPATDFDYFEACEVDFVYIGKKKKRRGGNKKKNKRKTRMGNALNALDEPDAETKESVLGNECSAKKIVENLKNGEYSRVVVMAGAGISVSCGIPDFRTKGTGLYDNLQRFNLPTPESVFELDYFRASKGQAFYKLAKEMWPDHFQPSPTHCFIRLLNDKGFLQRCFTQNIDTLERAAGVEDEKLVEAHGSFATASCIKCGGNFDSNTCKEKILAGDVPLRCGKPGCGGLVKPDIVFFGEGLPQKFSLCASMDMPQADLLIIMGTSLTVHPFAGLMDMVGPTCPRLLLNMKPVGLRLPDESNNGLRLRQSDNYRDVMIEGSCDDAVRAICDELGWREELEELVESFKSKVGHHNDPIDVNIAFPSMKPDGLAYNWRITSETPLTLPEPHPLAFHPPDFEVDLLDVVAGGNEHGIAMFGFEEYTTLHRGGQFAGLLCLQGTSHDKWESTHYLALVASDQTVLKFEAIHSCQPLAEPMRKQDDKSEEKAMYHQIALDIPRHLEQFDLWYVNPETGAVEHRWGPFQLSNKVADDQDEDEEDDTDALLNEIVHAMGELPAHLQEE